MADRVLICCRTADYIGTPVPGATEGTCAYCHEPVNVSPSGAGPVLSGYLVVCLGCFASRHPDQLADVVTSPTDAQLAEMRAAGVTASRKEIEAAHRGIMRQLRAEGILARLAEGALTLPDRLRRPRG